MKQGPSLLTCLMAGGVLVFLLAPTLIVVPMSFGNGDQMSFPPAHWSLNLYRQFFTQPEWTGSTQTSFIVAACTTALSTAISTPAAFALARSRERSARMIKALFSLPMLVPTIVLALALYIYFVPLGLTGTIPGLVLAHSIHVLPFAIAMILAGMNEVDPALERAVQILGASPMTVFLRVTVPLSMPAIVSAGLFSFLLSFDDIVFSWFLTSPRTMTLPIKMYSSIQFEISPVLAAVSTLMFALSSSICLTVVALRRGRQMAMVHA